MYSPINSNFECKVDTHPFTEELTHKSILKKKCHYQQVITIAIVAITALTIAAAFGCAYTGRALSNCTLMETGLILAVTWEAVPLFGGIPFCIVSLFYDAKREPKLGDDEMQNLSEPYHPSTEIGSSPE